MCFTKTIVFIQITQMDDNYIKPKNMKLQLSFLNFLLNVLGKVN